MTLLFGVVAVLLFALPSQLRPSHFLPDDSYFYLQIAHNIAAGRGSTFHEITPTNGYHPLWMAVCVVADRLVGHDKNALPHVVFAIQLLLTLGIAFLFRRIASALSLRYGWIALPVFAGYFLTGMYGSDAHLSGFCVAMSLFLLVLVGSPTSGTAHWVLFGCALGLAFLARLDNVFLVGALALVALARERRRGLGGLARHTLAVALPLAALAVPYLLENRLRYGHLVPISGAIKSSFPAFAFHPSHLGNLGMIVAVFALLSLGLVLTRRCSDAARPLLLALGLGVLAHACYIAGFTRPGIPWSWYFVPGVLNLCLVIAVVLERSPERAGAFDRRFAVGSAALLIALAGLGRAWLRYRDPEAAGIGHFVIRATVAPERWQIRLGEWMKRDLPAGSGVLVFDQPGALGYYSDLRVLPTDGLINDFAYNDDIVRMGIAAYLRAKDVRYYLGRVAGSGGGPEEIEILSPLSGRSAGRLTLLPGNLVARARDVIPSPDTPDIAIWKLDGSP